MRLNGSDAGRLKGLFEINRKERVMNILLFYLVACLFMGISAFLSGIQWNQANGVREYLRLVVLDKPFIIFITIVVFVLSGILMQIGKFHFGLSYYTISIIWLATSWVAFTVLWFHGGIKPSAGEIVGMVLCQAGLITSAIGKIT